MLCYLIQLNVGATAASAGLGCVAEAQTTYGVIGIKVWIFKGEVFDKPEEQAEEAEAEGAAAAQPKAAETAAPSVS